MVGGASRLGHPVTGQNVVRSNFVQLCRQRLAVASAIGRHRRAHASPERQARWCRGGGEASSAGRSHDRKTVPWAFASTRGAAATLRSGRTHGPGALCVSGDGIGLGVGEGCRHRRAGPECSVRLGRGGCGRRYPAARHVGGADSQKAVKQASPPSVWVVVLRQP
jgi:hypothetical protein